MSCRNEEKSGWGLCEKEEARVAFVSSEMGLGPILILFFFPFLTQNGHKPTQFQFSFDFYFFLIVGQKNL